jgi:NADPH2:quinone reductase
MATERFMTVVEIPRFGAPDVLTTSQREIPSATSKEVLIRVQAAGVSRPDILQRRGFYPPPPGASDLPGLEVAGTIAACGSDVTAYKVGDRVCALLAGGGYAEFAVAPAGQVLPIPEGWSAEEAAVLPENIFTVWENVFRRAHLKPEETILVHGGTSGIGSTAIMLAREFGATVIATAGTDAKCQACISMGAKAAIHYKTKDFVTETLQLTNGQGANVILDYIGADYLQRDINCLALDGRISLIGAQNGEQATLSIFALIRRRGTILASNLRPRTPEEKAAIADDLGQKVWPRLARRAAFRPMIDTVFTFADAAKAHERMERGQHVGKIILVANAHAPRPAGNVDAVTR